MPNQYKNKVVYFGDTLIDLSGDTLDPSKVLQGYTGHDATGAPFTGTYIPPSGAISVVDTSDSHGGTVRTITAVDISDTTAVASDVASGKYFYTADGTKTAGTASGGGLEYESGTWTPTEDVARGEIFFSNTHTDMPFFIMLTDVSGDYYDTLQSNLAFYYMDWEKVFGEPFYMSSTTEQYGLTYNRYRSSNANSTTASYNGIRNPSSDTNDGTTSFFRYYATNTKFMPYTDGDSRYWRAGRTYKWIAVWAPTT